MNPYCKVPDIRASRKGTLEPPVGQDLTGTISHSYSKIHIYTRLAPHLRKICPQMTDTRESEAYRVVRPIHRNQVSGAKPGQILKNLHNARTVWGDQSSQYAASKHIAESFSNAGSEDSEEATHDSLVAQLETLALNS